MVRAMVGVKDRHIVEAGTIIFEVTGVDMINRLNNLIGSMVKIMVGILKIMDTFGFGVTVGIADLISVFASGPRVEAEDVTF